jgi:hypothetical protein
VRRLVLLALLIGGIVAFREWRIRQLEAVLDPDRAG